MVMGGVIQEEEKTLARRTLAIAAIGAALSLVIGLSADAATKKPAPKLVKYKVVDGTSIPKSLTGKAGDAKKGRKLAIHRKKGNCLACHKLPIPEQQFHGNIGPDLAGVAGRYSEGEMRLRLVDPKVVNDDTIMPSFYRNTGYTAVLKKFKGKTVISAQDVEDILAYLKTLK
jgi:L-cysteine S-thiosulfotransferase